MGIEEYINWLKGLESQGYKYVVQKSSRTPIISNNLKGLPLDINATVIYEWQPSECEECYGINFEHGCGYTPIQFKIGLMKAFEKGLIVKTEKEAIHKCEEIERVLNIKFVEYKEEDECSACGCQECECEDECSVCGCQNSVCECSE